jgi:hypothetical protein
MFHWNPSMIDGWRTDHRPPPADPARTGGAAPLDLRGCTVLDGDAGSGAGWMTRWFQRAVRLLRWAAVAFLAVPTGTVLIAVVNRF